MAFAFQGGNERRPCQDRIDGGACNGTSDKSVSSDNGGVGVSGGGAFMSSRFLITDTNNDKPRTTSS